ncbi:2-dehydropantoate 2-reductase [Cytobacillus sp. NCCP-133]|uniref:2-dehydropantoate 2-reductase n=1 Tax=Cytobacillus sp. NCCP-133 TaxID=766848 RepID=UPI002232B731|nr:2-dehydropantoate 2-reductase [Cytobacillus sp. NCCP-133]GLB61216.1 2-dehydropantoate 2-reductase [Cytobacillus sp. NCCP-133]
MKIAIIGGGAIGLLFANYLSEHHDIRIYVRSSSQAIKLRSQGLTFVRDGKQNKSLVKAELFSGWKGEEELTIIAVKQYSIPDVVSSIQKVNPVRPLSMLFLQNGMEHLKWISNIQTKRLFVGSVEHGALKIGPDTVEHTGVGVTKLAAIKGDAAFLKAISEPEFDHFPFVFRDDYRKMLAEKLIVNSVINPLTAVLRVRNGELLDNQYYFRLFLNLFEEASMVLGLSNKEAALEHVKSVCKSTGNNRSSMLKDIEAGRPTEIDAILGYILKEANDRKMAVPYSESLYCLVKGKE